MDKLQKLETISDIQNFLAAMYGEKNAVRHFEYLYSFAAQNCAYLARAVEKKSDPSQYFISSFSWICALATKLDINLQDAFLKKFPKCCPYCLERVCVCAKTNKTALKFTNQAAVLAERKNHYQTITNTNHGNSASEVAQWLGSVRKVLP